MVEIYVLAEVQNAMCVLSRDIVNLEVLNNYIIFSSLEGSKRSKQYSNSNYFKRLYNSFIDNEVLRDI